MNILIVGNGFLGNNLFNKFTKEGFNCFILEKDSINLKKKQYLQLDAKDPKCEKIFDLHNIDCVFYTIAPKNNDLKEVNSSLSALLNILSLSVKNKIKHFYFFSDLEDNFVMEDQNYRFFQVEAINLCKKYDDFYHLPITIFKTANLYSDNQQDLQKGYYPRLFIDWNLALKNNELPKFNKPQNFLHINDALEIIANTLKNNDEDKIKYLSSPYNIFIDNHKVLTFPKYESNYLLYHHVEKDILSYNLVKLEKEEIKQTKSFHWRKYLPFVENILLFSLVAFLTFISPSNDFINAIGIGYSQLYIIIIGILYGKSQAIISAILSIILFFYELSKNRIDFVVVFYYLPYQIHIIAYLFVALFIGYISDKHTLEKLHFKETIKKLRDEYSFLKTSYSELLSIKNKFYHQILNSTDSIGWLYSSIHRLYNIQSERIYTTSIQVITELMQTENAAIYSIDSKGIFLRQKIAIGKITDNLPKSIALDNEEYSFFKDICIKHTLFVNKSLKDNCPDMAVPIISGGKAIAIIALYKIPFEYFSAHYEKMLCLIALMIAEALDKASSFEKETKFKRYYPDSNILRPQAFSQIEEELKTRKNSYGKFQIISINNQKLENIDFEIKASELFNNLKGMVRENDFVGIKEGKCFILMPEFIDLASDVIMERFKKRKVVLKKIEVKDKGLNNE